VNHNELQKAYEYCRNVTRQHAKSFYFAAKFLPKTKQPPIYALYALCRHVDDEIDEAELRNEEESAAIVEQWKTNLEALYSSKVQSPKSKVQSLVLLAWRDLLQTYKIPQNLPLELMKGVSQDTYIKRYETFTELYVYCYRVASTVGLMACEIFGYEGNSTLDYAEKLGIAMQLTNILRDIGEDAEMGRIYLPQEDLRKFNVTEKQIFAKQIDANFIELMKFQIARARQYYEESKKGIPMLSKDVRFTVLLALRIYARILDEIERQNYDIFKQRAHTTKTQKFLSIPKIWLEARKM
jgi:15-cis-phytoene synthase